MTREAVGGGSNTDYLYDANGIRRGGTPRRGRRPHLTRKDDGTNTYDYAYDFRNLMTDYDGPGTSNDSTYTYDYVGRRITKDVNGTKTAYFHDALNVVAEYNGSNQLQRTYVTPGLDNNLTLTASGSTYYYLTDALGSIRQLIDSNEATQNSYDYFAFGKVYGTPTENVTQPFRFTGRAWDSESSLCYYRARNYAPSLGRFASRDPAGYTDGMNLYEYVRSNPTLYVDPLGLKKGRLRNYVDALWIGITTGTGAAPPVPVLKCCSTVGAANAYLRNKYVIGKCMLEGLDNTHKKACQAMNNLHKRWSRWYYVNCM